MYRIMLLCLCLFPALPGMAAAEPGKPAARKQAVKEPAAKQLSGMSIVGNDEAPKSLYIMPWKRSEIGDETSLNMMLTESAVPVDREVFRRQLEFFEVSTKK